MNSPEPPTDLGVEECMRAISITRQIDENTSFHSSASGFDEDGKRAIHLPIDSGSDTSSGNSEDSAVEWVGSSDEMGSDSEMKAFDEFTSSSSSSSSTSL